MPQDAFTLRLVAKELDAALAGGKINRVNQPDKDELSLIIYTGKRTVKLILSANAATCGAYFSDEARENPSVAPNFCMLLRKYAQGAEILGVDMPAFERILRFRLMCRTEFTACERTLVAEIMGKYSNLILTENGTILGALKTAPLDENAKRAVFAGAKYVPPLPQEEKVDPSDFSALSARLRLCGEDRGRFLFLNVRGLAPSTAEDIAASYRGGDFARHVYDFIFSDELSPCVTVRDGVPVDFSARGHGIPYPTLSEAQSAFYRSKRAGRAFEARKRKLLTLLNGAAKKQEKQLAQLLEKKLACADLEEDRIRGELLTANIYALSRGMRKCTLENWFSEEGGTLEIDLDPRLTPAENAQAYYKRYRKKKRTVEAVVPREKETRDEIAYLASLLALTGSASEEQDLASVEEELYGAGLLALPKERQKKRPEIPYRVYEREGMTILAGRNNLQNDRLVRQSAPDDIWLHARRYHSCHAVIKSGGKDVPPSVLSFAAGVCALYSDAHGDKIPVDVCAVKYVRKPPKSKAGFVTYSNFQTVLGDPALADAPKRS